MRLRSQTSVIREENQDGRLLQTQHTLNKNNNLDLKKINAEISAIEKMHGKADIIDNSISNPEACDK